MSPFYGAMQGKSTFLHHEFPILATEFPCQPHVKPDNMPILAEK